MITYTYFAYKKVIYTQLIKNYLRLYKTFILKKEKIELLSSFIGSSGFITRKAIKE